MTPATQNDPTAGPSPGGAWRPADQVVHHDGTTTVRWDRDDVRHRVSCPGCGATGLVTKGGSEPRTCAQCVGYGFLTPATGIIIDHPEHHGLDSPNDGQKKRLLHLRRYRPNGAGD